MDTPAVAQPTPVLRRWRAADAEALLGIVGRSPDLSRQFGAERLGDLAGCRRFLIAELIADGPQAWNFAVESDGVPIGNVGVGHVERSHQTGWVHYWLDETARGQGLATRAVCTLSRWAFDDLDLVRLELGHRVDNPASCRVARRCGYAVEGVEREKLRYGDVRFDVETHARLRTDASPVVEPLSLRFATRRA